MKVFSGIPQGYRPVLDRSEAFIRELIIKRLTHMMSDMLEIKMLAQDSKDFDKTELVRIENAIQNAITELS